MVCFIQSYGLFYPIIWFVVSNHMVCLSNHMVCFLESCTEDVTFSIKSRSGYAWGFNGNQAVITTEASKLRIVEGLSGDTGSVSFESTDNPGSFIRHAGYVMWLHANDNSDLFKKDASFYPRENAFFGDFVAYESVNFPDYFITDANSRLKIVLKEDSDSYKNSASYKLKCPSGKMVLSGK